MFGLNKNNLDKEALRSGLENSKVYRWLKFIKLKDKKMKKFILEALSSIIHQSLIDDPKPYRQDVKKFQSNLYTYIKSLLPQEI